MRALGLDPSLRSYGWCVYDSLAEGKEKRVASGHEATLPSTVPEARFIHFRALVRDLLRRWRVDVVGLESPAYGGGAYSETHFGLMMYSREAVFESRTDLVLFDPTTLKYLTGKSDASKSDMQRFVQLQTMDPDPLQADEADAFCAAHFAVRFMKVRSGELDPDAISRQERRVFLQRTKTVKTIRGKRRRRTAHAFRENSRFFQFSKVPEGSTDLPDKDLVEPGLLAWLEDQDP